LTETNQKQELAMRIRLKLNLAHRWVPAASVSLVWYSCLLSLSMERKKRMPY